MRRRDDQREINEADLYVCFARVFAASVLTARSHKDVTQAFPMAAPGPVLMFLRGKTNGLQGKAFRGRWGPITLHLSRDKAPR